MCVFSGAKGVGSSAQTHTRKTIIMMMMAAAAAAAVVLVAPKAQLYQLFSLIDLAHSATPLSMYVCVCVCLCSMFGSNAQRMPNHFARADKNKANPVFGERMETKCRNSA